MISIYKTSKVRKGRKPCIALTEQLSSKRGKTARMICAGDNR